MLNKYWKLHFVNESGQTMTVATGAIIEVRIMPWKLTAGALVYGDVITEDLGQTAEIADDAVTVGDAVDNTVNLFLGATGTAEITHDVDAALGQYRIYLESCDDSTNWPSAASDFKITDLIQVCVIPVDNSAVDKSRSKNFVL